MFRADPGKYIVMILWKQPHTNEHPFVSWKSHKKERKNAIRVSYLDHLYALFPGKQNSGKTNYEYFILIP